MEKIFEKTLLYDFYGELLTAHQREIYEDVVFNDMSLSEAAEAYGVSRQGIHDMIRRCDAALSGYEEKLHLVEQFESVRKKAQRIRVLAGQDADIPVAACREIRELTEQILTEIG